MYGGRFMMRQKLFLIPLIALVVVTGLFALLPIYEASTVHTSVQTTALEVIRISSADAGSSTMTRNVAVETITIDCNKDFLLTAVQLDGTLDDNADNFDIDAITLDSVTLEFEAALDIHSAAGTLDSELLGVINNNQVEDAPLAGGLSIPAFGAGTNDIVFRTAGAAAGADDTVNLFATILSSADAVCTINGS